MKNCIILLTLLVIGSGLVFSVLPQPVSAAGIVPDKCQRDQGINSGRDCSLNDLVALVINVINFLFSAVGFVTILFIVYGGIQMLMSGGNPDSIKNGKATITNAIVGLVIVLTSFLIINFVVYELSGGSIGGFNQLFSFWK